MTELNVEMIQHQIGGYKFKNLKLLQQAFTRKSYSEEHGGENNEVLEFIGDRAIELAVVCYLSNRYGTDLHLYDNIPAQFRVPQEPKEFHSDLSEGELTRLKQKMVEKKAFALRIDDLDIAQFLIMGEGDKKAHAEEQPSVKEDLFEAIVGAVALDSNWDFNAIKNVVEIMLCPEMFIENDEETDYVGLIYDWEYQKNNSEPYFKYFEKSASSSWYFRDRRIKYQMVQGTYELNNFKNACQLRLSTGAMFEGYGLSKHEARKAVCKMAYEFLEEHNMLLTIADEIDEPSVEMAINQLEILARRGYFSVPEYEYEETHDEDGNPIWNVKCYIDEVECYFEAESSSKKHAKKEAAFDMLQYVLENYDKN